MEAFYNIIISPLAKETYFHNIEYLNSFWTIKEVNNFIEKTEDVTIILKIAPRTFKKRYLNVDIHQMEIVKQITLYYQINEKNVELLLFFNNHQNPNALRKALI